MFLIEKMEELDERNEKNMRDVIARSRTSKSPLESWEFLIISEH